METGPSPLDTFDHVVVLMLENRSFDNILGYLYRDGVPSGKKFEGVVGKELSNPDITDTPIPVSANAEVHQPYPDPGEEFHHVTMQLFSSPQATGEPGMKGFVRDYYDTLQALRRAVPPWTGSAAEQSVQIMRCFAPSTLPVLSELAKKFAVFDNWFCAVPSQTWCNRAFWHAATSWGWVNNPPISTPDNPWGLDHWARSSAGPTSFNLLEEKFGAGSWSVYSDLPVPFTKLIHFGALKDKVGETYFPYLQGGFHFGKNFFDDCATGDLPKYSFLEPHFINFFEDAPWHDDMHPSSSAQSSTQTVDRGPSCSAIGSYGRSIKRSVTRTAKPETTGGTPCSSSPSTNTAGVSITSHRRRRHPPIRKVSTPEPARRASISKGWASECQW